MPPYFGRKQLHAKLSIANQFFLKPVNGQIHQVSSVCSGENLNTLSFLMFSQQPNKAETNPNKPQPQKYKPKYLDTHIYHLYKTLISQIRFLKNQTKHELRNKVKLNPFKLIQKC